MKHNNYLFNVKFAGYHPLYRSYPALTYVATYRPMRLRRLLEAEPLRSMTRQSMGKIAIAPRCRLLHSRL